MEKPSLDRMWETFLRLDITPATPPAAAVLRRIRVDVLPLVRRLEADRVVEWYSFLVHDAESGVATSPDDTNAYVHLRLGLSADHAELDLVTHLPQPWSMTQRIVAPSCREIGGLDRSAFLDEDIERAWWLIGQQSEWMLNLIEQHGPEVPELLLLNQIGQFLHYFANMAQMRVA